MTTMKICYFAFCLLYLFETRVQSKPQITKLFPVREKIEYHRQISNGTKPLDKFLGKLQATYNFVFRKRENTSNVEKILAKDAPNSDAEALKLLWSNEMQQESKEETNIGKIYARPRPTEVTFPAMDDDWVNNIQPPNRLETLEPLELEDEIDNEDRKVGNVTPRTNLKLPVTISRHLVDWLGSLLGITYGVYAKLARAIHSNNTI